MKSMQLQFEKANAVVNLEVKGEAFTMKADQMHITSVIYNLLDNAIKYSPNPVIITTIISNDKDIELRVKDNGIGIDPIYKDKIFEKFFRVPHGNHHDVKGYGLGLSYAAHIIEEHKGCIDVNSDGRNGTTFTIKLPTNNGG
jgi:two-component system phosphate regulon sensor histidine kinase PhoR